MLLVAVWVDVRTPAALLLAPQRPYAEQGNPEVRLGPATYPRTATGADNVTVTIASPPRRIVSQYWSTDEFLYAIVPPERIVGVSQTAHSRASSNVLGEVERFHPIVATDAEQILRADPDLVLTPESESSEEPALLREAGVPVYRIFTVFETLQSIEDHMRLMGYLSGEDAKAAAVLATFRATVARAAARRPAGIAAPRVLGMAGNYSYGSHTVFNDILQTLGAENLAASHGFRGYDRVTDEHIVRWNPDWIFVGADRGQADRVRAEILARAPIAATAAAAQGRVIVIENDVFLPLSPFTARLVDVISRALYGDGS
jgi:iron complex transport system substrate-binding protein